MPLPLGAVIVAFFAVAVPAILLMTVWAGVMAFRLLFPEDGLPHSGRTPPSMPGDMRPVRLRDILEDQQRTREKVSAQPGEYPESNPLFDDLWLRRN
ncbi:MAG: hypothetical protein AAGK21_02945 [Bacteroidota bacterium]